MLFFDSTFIINLFTFRIFETSIQNSNDLINVSFASLSSLECDFYSYSVGFLRNWQWSCLHIWCSSPSFMEFHFWKWAWIMKRKCTTYFIQTSSIHFLNLHKSTKCKSINFLEFNSSVRSQIWFVHLLELLDF